MSFNRLLAAVISRICVWLPDDIYLKTRYRLIMKSKLHIDNPQTFNEKLNWLKVYHRIPFYTLLVDKSTVKEYLESIIGKEHIIPTLGIWDDFNQINFESLPEKYVLKSTNGGGGDGIIICKDKYKLNYYRTRIKLAKSMKSDWRIQREWVYRDIKPRILAEEYLKSGSDGLNDYKFFCFNGMVQLFKVDFDRFVGHRANYYDRNLNLLSFGEKLCPPNFEKKIVFPESIKKMIELAEKISCNIPFVRVDLYEVNGNIYFGEMTFFPNSGFGKFTDEGWDYKLGSWLVLPNIQ